MPKKSKPQVSASRANALQVEYVPADSLTLDPGNVRAHSERNMEAVKASLAGFGPYQPLAVVDADGIVRVGNARIQAARELGYEQVPIVRSELRGAQAEALAIADNRTSELAEWDDGLADVLERLRADEDVDHLLTGFEDEEIAALAAAPDAPTALKTISVQPPPAMTWALIGVPTVQFGEVAALVEQASEIDGSIVETTANNG